MSIKSDKKAAAGKVTILWRVSCLIHISLLFSFHLSYSLHTGLLVDLTISSTIMIADQCTLLITRGVELYRSILEASSSSDAECLGAWLSYEKDVIHTMKSGLVDCHTASAISAIATDVRNSASAVLALDQYSDDAIEQITMEVKGLSVRGGEGESRPFVFQTYTEICSRRQASVHT